MSRIHTKLAALETLSDALARLVENLSFDRARIAMDQLHGAVESHSLDKIVFVTASESDAIDTPIAAAIAIQQTDARTKQASDLATIVHAASLQSSEDAAGDASRGEVIEALSAAVDRALFERGARFLQWPTDPSDRPDDELAQWCRGFGFESIGTLDYLGGKARTEDSPLLMLAGQDPELRYEPIDWDRDGDFKQFAQLIEETYEETLDCPDLAAYRTAAQTLSGYQTSAAFDKDYWLTIYDASGRPIGCLILAVHRSKSAAGGQRTPVVEIVYMGLIPASRGKGIGKRIVHRAFQAAREIGAERIILAVDRRNAPARSVYELAGLEPMLQETVWVKSLNLEA